MANKLTKKYSGRYELKYRGSKCENYTHLLELSDKYCPNCSQANSTKKLSLKDFFDEFFASVISYDSKLLKTISALLLRPGKITKEYIDGKRLSYTNPFRFLLSLSIIYFLMISYSNDFSSLDKYRTKNNKSNFSDYLPFKNPKKHFSALKDSSLSLRFLKKIDFFKNAIIQDTIYSFDDATKKYLINNTKENQIAFNSANKINKLEHQPESFISTIISRLPFTTFFFLPVFAFFIWMIYIRKKYTYTDHIIFSFHNQTLFFILLILSYLFNQIFKINSEGVFLMIFLFYLYKSMRNFYKQGRFITIIKYLFLNTVFVILACIAIILVLTGSIFTL